MASDFRDGGIVAPSDLALREGGFPVGVIPVPEALARYNAIVPGAAERILRLAEEGAEQQYQLERARLEVEKERWNVELGTATGIAALCIVSGFITILAASAFAGLVLAMAGVALLGAALVYAARRQRPAARGRVTPPAVREVAAFDL